VGVSLEFSQEVPTEEYTSRDFRPKYPVRPGRSVQGRTGGPDGKLFIAVLSTEELVLNACQQQCTSQELALAVDTSYRLVSDNGKFGLLPVKVVNFAQEARVVAYTICSKENEGAHDFVFEVLKEEVERVVHDRVRKGKKI
jgi:hypothetical protein